jgi:hypothetical protein
VTCLTLFAPITFNGFGAQSLVSSQVAFAQSQIPQGWESYLGRPDIFSISPQAHEFDSNWEAVKAAHFSFVAELLALYPDTDLYFLARDSEYLYDVAKLVTAGTPAAKRIHLLNVSRLNLGDPHLKEYLNENGLSEDTLMAERRALLVDTGYIGNIPRAIGAKFSPQASNRLKTHLIVSANPAHPSSRAFLVHLNPSINAIDPATMEEALQDFEHMAHSFDRSTQFIYSEGRWHPVSPKVDPFRQSADKVSAPQSLKYMADLKNEWLKPETQARVQKEMAQVKWIDHLLREGSEYAKSKIRGGLESRHQKDLEEVRLFEAHVRDILGAQGNTGLKYHLGLEDVGLEVVKPIERFGMDRRHHLVNMHPEWAKIIQRPKEEVPKLFQAQDWQTIRALFDANLDEDVNVALLKNLFDAPAQGIKREMQLNIFATANRRTWETLVGYLYRHPRLSEMSFLLKLMIEKGDAEELGLVSTIFSRPETKDMRDLLKLLIERTPGIHLPILDYYVFDEPHTKGPEYEVLRKAAHIENDAERKKFLDDNFAKPRTLFKKTPKMCSKTFL